jgi:Ca2+/Na+ antiporter
MVYLRSLSGEPAVSNLAQHSEAGGVIFNMAGVLSLVRGFKLRVFRATPVCAKEIIMLWTIFVVLLILWLLGFSFHIAGGLIHLLLVVAVVVLIINLVSGRRLA